MNIIKEIKQCYKIFVSINPKLNFYISIQILLIAFSRTSLALSTLCLTYFINQHYKITFFESISIGIVFFYCISKVFEFLLNIIQLRFYSNKILPCSLVFIDNIIEIAIKNFQHFSEKYTPLELATLLNKKNEARNFLGYLFNHILNPFLELIICTILLVKIGFGLLGFMLIPACSIYFLISIVLLPLLKKQMTKIISLSAKNTNTFSSCLNKTNIANTFGTTSILCEHLNNLTKKEMVEYKKQLVINDTMYGTLNIPLVIFSCIFFYFGADMVLKDEVTYGAFAGFISIILNSFSQLKNLTFAFDGLNQSLSALNFPLKVFNECQNLKKYNKLNTYEDINNLQLKDFSIEYLKNKFKINIKVEKNEKIFIMGNSGSGKSSIIKALLGYTKFDGNILINGEKINREKLIFSWMPQESHDFEGSVRFNLSLGNQMSSDDDMWEALEKVNMKEKILSIGGLDSILEYQAKNISGGEKQRLNLARALLSKNQILLLDEPSSSLDIKLEKDIYDIIYGLDKMVIIISHGIKNIKDNSKILYINNGNVSFKTKKELLNNNSIFKKYYLN